MPSNSLSLSNNGALYHTPACSNDFSDISFFCFVKIATKNQANVVFTNGHSGDFGQGFLFLIDDDAGGNKLGVDISFVSFKSGTLAITDANWHFVGFQRRASDGVWILWLDSNSEEVGTGDPFGNDGSSKTVVGGANDVGSVTHEFSGLISRVGFWEQLLSSTDITNLRTGSLVSSIPTSLVVDLPLDNSSAWGTNGGTGGNFTEDGTLTLNPDNPFASSSHIGSLLAMFQ